MLIVDTHCSDVCCDEFPMPQIDCTPFFVNLVVDAWNYLPDNIIDFDSLSAFKRIIKLIDCD